MKNLMVKVLAIATAVFLSTFLANANEFEIDCEITVLDRNFENAENAEFQLIDFRSGNIISAAKTEANGKIQIRLLPGVYELKFKNKSDEFVYKFEINPSDNDFNLILRLPVTTTELNESAQMNSALSMSFDDPEGDRLTENFGRKDQGGIPLHEITPTLRDLANNSKIRP